MIDVLGPGARLCDGSTRRQILRVGGLGLAAGTVGLPALLRADEARSRVAPNPEIPRFGQAKACIVVFLMGGPPQHSTWDPKPDAPEAVRGPFAPIATRVPGMQLSELMPNLAEVADKLCVLRAVATDDNAHSSSGYYMLTGVPHRPKQVENANPGAPNDHPSLSALVGALAPASGGLPGSIRLPHRIFNTDGSVWPGQDAGFLGRVADPWLLNAAPAGGGMAIQEIALPEDLDTLRVERRRLLLDGMARGFDAVHVSPVSRVLDAHTAQAHALLGSPAARAAFDVESEPDGVRDRYGRTPLGYCTLLARRLVDAGVRLVHVNWYRGADEPPMNPCWDSHVDEPNRLKSVLVPPTDRALAALIGELAESGRLDETLVVCLSEFGRSPQLDAAGGRGHWGHVFSVALAGGGIRGGMVYGDSDRHAAYPKDGLVRPEDLFATILHCLGIAPDTEYRDNQGRFQFASRGQALRSILA
jgi:hypothetical protein